MAIYNYKKEQRLKELRKAKATFKSTSRKAQIREINKPPKPVRIEYKPYADKDIEHFTASKKPKPILKKGERQTSLGERVIADWFLQRWIVMIIVFTMNIHFKPINYGNINHL